MENSIEFNNVWKSFRRGERTTLLRRAAPNARPNESFWALSGVSFEAKKGEMLGIIGPNGAGKTTILNLLANILKPNKGNIVIKGRVACLVIAGAGFITEFTGRENIYFNGALMGMKKREIDKKFDSIVDFAGYGFPNYEKFIDTPVKWYSIGMFARLGFSIAAHAEADILLVDEILAVGDFMFQQKCFEYMSVLKKKAVTIVFVSHNMHHIITYCDRTIFLKNSKIVIDGKPCDAVSAFEHEMSKEASLVNAGDIPAFETTGGFILDNVVFENTTQAKEEPHLDYGERIEVSFDYNSLNCPLEDITFSLVARRKIDKYICFRIFSHMQDCYPTKKEGRIKLTVKDHNLMPGDYAFDIEARSIKSNMLLAVHSGQELLIKHTTEYLDPQLCGVYQPGHVFWDLHG